MRHAHDGVIFDTEQSRLLYQYSRKVMTQEGWRQAIFFIDEPGTFRIYAAHQLNGTAKPRFFRTLTTPSAPMERFLEEMSAEETFNWAYQYGCATESIREAVGLPVLSYERPDLTQDQEV